MNTYGGAGDGPGEFRSPVGVFEYRGDSLAAFDQRLRRTTIFDRSSGLSRTVQNQVEGNFVVFGLVEDGPFLLYNPGQYRPELLPGLQWDSTDVVAMNRADGSYEVVARLPVYQRLIGPGGSRESLIPAGVSIKAVAGDGFYWATSDRYEITFAAGNRVLGGQCIEDLRRSPHSRSQDAGPAPGRRERPKCAGTPLRLASPWQFTSAFQRDLQLSCRWSSASAHSLGKTR